MARAIAVLATMIAGLGCKATGTFQCAESEQCRLGGEVGVCEPSGFCSFDDPDCPSGRRYDDAAGNGLAGLCVGDEPAVDAGADAEPRVDAQPIGCFVSATVGDDSVCVRRSDGAAFCFGRNVEGQLTGDLADPALTPTALSSPAIVTRVETEYRHTCALTSGGQMRCWGKNTSGELGNNSTTNSPTPVVPVGLDEVSDLSLGDESTCAVFAEDGGVFCWGRNAEGQAGDGSAMLELHTPVRVQLETGGDLVGADRVVSGRRFACAVVSGDLYCWGANDKGQIGDGNGTGGATQPEAVPVGLSNVVDIAAGHEHACAQLGDGSLHCWGNNDKGQVGNGTGDGFLVSPVEISLPAPPVMLALGREHSCALLGGGELHCWGDNLRGQIAAPASSEIPAPAPVTDLGTPNAVAAGGFNTCAITGETILCRGENDQGQLGIGSEDLAVHADPETVQLSCP